MRSLRTFRTSIFGRDILCFSITVKSFEIYSLLLPPVRSTTANEVRSDGLIKKRRKKGLRGNQKESLIVGSLQMKIDLPLELLIS